MIPYILHVALLISVCLLFYKILLEKETFYRLNRWVLVSCLSLSFLLPLISIPQQWSLRDSSFTAYQAKTDKVESQPVDILQAIAMQKKDAIKSAVNTKRKTTSITKTYYKPGTNKTEPVAAIQKSLYTVVMKWLILLYWIGVAAFGLNLLLQLAVLLYRSYSVTAITDGRFRIVELTGDKAPCSFGNTIFINPEKYDWDTYSQILLHEKEHVKQSHSFDILIAELMLVVQWFNPFAWLYRKEVENNLEFLTDASVLENQDVERTSYQMSLVKVSAPHMSLSITTNYNQSLLKKRVIMMNSKRSNFNTMWKYFFLVPLIGLLACALNQPSVYGQLVNNKLQKSKNFPLHIQHIPVSSPAEGTWFATIKDEKVKVEFRSNNDQDWSSSSDFLLSEFSALPKDAKGDFTLIRESGTVFFNGKFDGNQGYGQYRFKADANFNDYLSRYGIVGIKESDEFAFLMLNIKKEFIAMMVANGYNHLTKDELISMTALKVDANYVTYWKGLGYHLTPDELVSGKALGLNSAYVDEIRKAGFTNVTFEQLVSFKATGVTGKYIAGLHGADRPGKNSGDAKLSADDVVSVKALNVDSAYVNEIQKEGYPNISLADLTSLKAVGVTPAYIHELNAAGYHNIPAEELVSLKATGVTPDYLKGFSNIGYKSIPLEDLTSMKATGVTPEYVQGFQAAGYKNIAVSDLVSLKAQQISPSFIKSYQAIGYKSVPIEDLSALKALGISPEYIQSFRNIGYNNVPLTDFTSLKAQGVTADFVLGFKKIGYQNVSLDEVGALKATGVTPAYVTAMKGKGFKSDDLNKYIELKNSFR